MCVCVWGGGQIIGFLASRFAGEDAVISQSVHQASGK